MVLEYRLLTPLQYVVVYAPIQAEFLSAVFRLGIGFKLIKIQAWLKRTETSIPDRHSISLKTSSLDVFGG